MNALQLYGWVPWFPAKPPLALAKLQGALGPSETAGGPWPLLSRKVSSLADHKQVSSGFGGFLLKNQRCSLTPATNLENLEPRQTRDMVSYDRSIDFI